MGDLTEEVKEFAKKFGANLVGITSAESWEAEEGHRPTNYLKGSKSVVVLGIRMLDSILDSDLHRPMIHYTKVVDGMLDQLAYKMSLMLSDRGFSAYPMDDHFPMGTMDQGYRSSQWFREFEKSPLYKSHISGDVSFKYAAKRAGLGVYGKSGLLITPQYGPRVRFCLVLTNALLQADPPIEIDFCRGCQVCTRLCPGKAITEEGHDSAACFRSELVSGVSAIGIPFRFCPSYCLRKCPVGILKEKYQIPLIR